MFTSDAATDVEQQRKSFMVLALAGLLPELDFVHNQILPCSHVPSYYMESELLHLSTPQAFGHASAPPTSILVSRSSYHGEQNGDCDDQCCGTC